MIRITPDFKVNRKDPPSRGRAEVRLKNTLEKPVSAEIVFSSNTNWRITPPIITLEAQPGEGAKRTVQFTCSSSELLPLPTYGYAILYGGEQLYGRSEVINPVASADMHQLKDWSILGAFELGVTELPTTPGIYPVNFTADHLPELNDSAYRGKTGQIYWQEYRAEDGMVNLGEAFGEPNWAIGLRSNPH